MNLYKRKGATVEKLVLELDPKSGILTANSFREEMTTGWGSYRYGIYNPNNRINPIDDLATLHGLSSVRFSFEVERASYKIETDTEIPGLEKGTEFEFPKVTVDNIDIPISRKTLYTVIKLVGLMNSRFKDKNLIIREGGTCVKPGAYLPGLLRVTITVFINIEDTIGMPEDQLKIVQKYLPSTETNPRTWGYY